MKAIIQRVNSASVSVERQVISSIGQGLLVFAAVAPTDGEKEVEAMASKVLRFKVWPDEASSGWKRSVMDMDGEVLCVSQFTLLASTKKGSKPDFHGAASGALARGLYEHFVKTVKDLYQAEKVKNGVFQAMMEVSLVNDGPVTFELESSPAVRGIAKAIHTGLQKPASLIEGDDSTAK